MKVSPSQSSGICLGPLVLLLASFSGLAHGYSSGTGTPEDPYEIATAQDLVDLGNAPNDYDKHFVLAADIDLSGYTFDHAVIAEEDTEANTSGFQETAFGGTFDGNGHRILNLAITGEAYLGLFGQIGSQGKVSNLGIVDANVIGTGEITKLRYIGGLVGKNLGSLVNCHSSGNVSGSRYVGGLVGDNSGSIRASHSSGVVRGESFSGGLLGAIRAASVQATALASSLEKRLVASEMRLSVASWA